MESFPANSLYLGSLLAGRVFLRLSYARGNGGMARYPKIHVQVRSANPLALVSAVRHELRRAGVAHTEIRRFSDEALESRDSGEIRRVCRSWVEITG